MFGATAPLCIGCGVVRWGDLSCLNCPSQYSGSNNPFLFSFFFFVFVFFFLMYVLKPILVLRKLCTRVKLFYGCRGRVNLTVHLFSFCFSCFLARVRTYTFHPFSGLMQALGSANLLNVRNMNV